MDYITNKPNTQSISTILDNDRINQTYNDMFNEPYNNANNYLDTFNDNVQYGFENGLNDFRQTVSQPFEAVGDFGANVNNGINNVVDNLNDGIDTFGDNLNNGLEDITQGFNDNMQGINATVQGVGDSFQNTLGTLNDGIGDVVENINENVDDLGDSLNDFVDSSKDMFDFGLGDTSSPAQEPTSNGNGDDEGFFSWLYGFTWKTWLLIIFVLAILGFNVFLALAKGTEDIKNIFELIFGKFLALFGMITGKVINISAQGAKGLVNTSASVVDAGLTGVQNVGSGISTISSGGGGNISQINTKPNNTPIKYEFNPSVSAMDASGVQGQSGWCYVGSENGSRSCVKVGQNDTCMSGDIFPSQEICINPTLRM